MSAKSAQIAPSLQAFVIGANDLAKDSGVPQVEGRWNMLPWFSEVVLAASAAGLGVMDSVSNNFRDLEAFERECLQGAALGMRGKTLIHPAQIEAANRAFGPSPSDIERAKAIISTFSDPTNADKGAVQIDGEMVERLHLLGAEEVIRRASTLKLVQE
jgi:citrate lyase subunit beta/citryl-CoA lyase